MPDHDTATPPTPATCPMTWQGFLDRNWKGTDPDTLKCLKCGGSPVDHS